MADQPPPSSTDPTQWLASLLQVNQQVMDSFAKNVAQGATADAATNPWAAFSAVAKQAVDFQQAYLQQMTQLWSGLLPGATSGTVSAKDADRRFAGEAWNNDPRFELLKRNYLGYSAYLQQLVDSAAVDERTKGQMQFAMRQYVDAISPANFLVSNPEAMQLAMQTGGQSLIDGMQLFAQDLARGRVSSTDETAFVVGRNVAITEGAVVFENELVQIIQYAPRTQRVFARPLVIIPPCINKYYILDLQPENSLVRYAVEQGQTVFLASWRNATAEVAHLTWDDYIERGVLTALKVSLEISGADRVNALGFCIGGTLLSSALAVQAARGVEQVAAVTLLTTMLDFSDVGEIGLLIDAASVTQREQSIGKGGLLPGKDLALVFSALRANDLIWPYVVNSYLKGKKPPPFDLLFWNSDLTNLPGPMFCWYLRNTYLNNALRIPHGTVQCGEQVNLLKVRIPAFIYASREDHIVPWATAYASVQLLGGHNTFVLGASGHIAGVINPAAKNKRNYWVGGNDKGGADNWLQTASSVPGSWWNYWSGWLAGHAGDEVPARVFLGNEQYLPIEPAPGRYVKASAE